MSDTLKHVSDESYNGFTNRETWLTNLWLQNAEGDYNHWSERALDIYREATAAVARDESVGVLAEEIREETESLAHELTFGQWGLLVDLLNTALAEVNWREIADHFLDAAVERLKQTV